MCLFCLQQDNNFGKNMTIWQLTGNQGEGWKVGEASVPEGIIWTYNSRIFISASRGDGIHGDIAIDDISSTTGICNPDSKLH